MAEAPDRFISLNHFRCSSCTGYLSCGPIQLTPEGMWICGNCSPDNSDVAFYRELTLEAVLDKATFPCKFEANGCRNQMLFNNTVVHEAECAYRTYKCPAMPSGCSWEGSAFQIADHLKSQHPDLVGTGIGGVPKTRWRIWTYLRRIKLGRNINLL